MPGLSYDVVDVFCDRPFAGNPLAVVHGAAGLGTARMQALAREFNLSETAFPQPRDDRSYDVRIFTPAAEIPFAGHPTAGTAWLLGRRGELRVGGVVQHCAAGPVEVVVTADGAELSTRSRYVTGQGDPAPLAAAVGLADATIGPARVASCGLAWTFLRVRPDAVAQATAAPSGWAPPAAGDDPMGGLCVYAVHQDPGRTSALAVHARVFCPEHSIVEDPATGSAALALGAVLVADGLAAGDGTTSYTIAQGAEIGRPSTLRAGVDAAAGAAVHVRVGGGVAHIASGTITAPG